MTCPACEEAKTNRWCGHYRADCLGCSARALSHSPAYYFAAQDNAITPAYRDALISVWGAEWAEGHQLVKAWANRGQA